MESLFGRAYSGFVAIAMPMSDHGYVQVCNGLAAAPRAEKRENTVSETSKASQQHFSAKRKSAAHMLGIGLANALRVLSK